MQLANIPAKFNIPFASSAGAGFIRSIPQTPTGTPGQASLQEGFPSENFQPVAAGGVPPFGQDFNGILNQSTAWNQWQSAGLAFPPYDPTFQTAIGGYPDTALVTSAVTANLVYMSVVDNNVTNPDTGGAGWIVFWRQLATNTDLYVNGATGNDSNNGLTPATAKKTIQGAVNTAWTFPPSSAFGITIHISDGTYNESVSTPSIPGPAVTILGNNATPSNVIVNSVTINAGAITVNGPNVLTVSSLKFTGSVSGSGAGLVANNSGSLLIAMNTVSGAVDTGVFLANGGGAIAIEGNHTFAGSCAAAFLCSRSGTINTISSITFTISVAITVGIAFVESTSGGSLEVPLLNPPNFANPGNVTGPRFLASLNGVINTHGQGANYFPGSTAGSTTTGGQYA
jgi:hypothetical protein